MGGGGEGAHTPEVEEYYKECVHVLEREREREREKARVRVNICVRVCEKMPEKKKQTETMLFFYN